MADQALATLSKWGANNSMYTQFSLQAETRAWYVHTSVAHSCIWSIRSVIFHLGG